MSENFRSGQKLVATGTDENNKQIEAVVIFECYLAPEQQKKIELNSGRTGILDCVIKVIREDKYNREESIENNLASSFALSTIH